MAGLYPYLLKDFLSLFYPEACPGCNLVLVKGEKLICTHCFYYLPRTNFHLFPDNEAAQLLWGRIPFHSLTSFLFFRKGSRVESLLYAIKYRGIERLAFELGKIFGEEIRNSGWFADLDGLVPVPLHPKKQAKRGYNQSNEFANGIADVIDLPVFPNALVKRDHKESITQKGRADRWQALCSSVSIGVSQDIEGKSILLVDDVLTTGATLEVCSQVLWDAKIKSLKLATLARRQG